jgi:hypothetical protein
MGSFTADRNEPAALLTYCQELKETTTTIRNKKILHQPTQQHFGSIESQGQLLAMINTVEKTNGFAIGCSPSSLFRHSITPRRQKY